MYAEISTPRRDEREIDATAGLRAVCHTHDDDATIMCDIHEGSSRLSPNSVMDFDSVVVALNREECCSVVFLLSILANDSIRERERRTNNC